MSEHSLATVNVSGDDAFEFLQNQLTNDLQRLSAEAEILAAWCNPKGRVIWFGTIRKTDSGYAMSVPAATAEDLVRRLTMFRFRAKVEFSVDEGGTVDAGLLIENGYPFVGRDQAEKFTPHMLNLDRIDAISFDKGCYPGQEIVARTYYRGATKRRCQRFESDKPLAPGDKVSDGSRDLGEVVNAAGTALLAVVPVDADRDALSAGDIRLRPMPLPYSLD